MGVLYARVSGSWVAISTPPTPQEVAVDPNDPGPGYDLWYDTDAVAPATALVPAGGATGQALIKASATDFNTTWGTGPRPANCAWGVQKYVNMGSGNAVNVPTTGLTLLHSRLNFTFLAGRQYKYCWNIRAQASNSGSPVAANMALYDGTVSTGWVDQWTIFAGQWASASGHVPIQDNLARSLALGFGGVPAALTIYFTHAWIEDIGPVAT